MFLRRQAFTSISFLLLLFVLRLALLPVFPLIDPTEGRYAEISRQMVTTNEWVLPRLKPSEPFWGKPVLPFWLIALSLKVLGINEFAARLPAFFLAVLCVLCTYLFARAALRDEKLAQLSALILATSGAFFACAGLVITDVTLTAAMTLVFCAFPLAIESETETKRKIWGYLFFAGLGLGVLAKGLVGWVIPFLPIAVWCACSANRKQCRESFRWSSGILLLLLLAVPWHVVAEMRTPGFLYYYFVGEHFQRYLVSSWQGDLYGGAHQTPFGMAVFYLAASCLPWLLFFPLAFIWLRRRGVIFWQWAKQKWVGYSLLWFLWPALFFSAARNVMLPYTLPCLPAFALVCGFLAKEIKRQLNAGERAPWFAKEGTVAATAALVPVVFSIAALLVLPQLSDELSEKALVNVFQAMAKSSGEKLVFIGSKPYSGLFYANGEAKLIDDEKLSEVDEALAKKENKYFAIANKVSKFMPQALYTQTVEVAQSPKYVLRKRP